MSDCETKKKQRMKNYNKKHELKIEFSQIKDTA